MRVCTVMPGRVAATLDQFDNVVFPHWARHGIKQLGFWTQVVGGNSSDLYYLLGWRR